MTGSGMRFNGLHETRPHLVVEIGTESSRAESQSLGIDPPVECRPVAHAATGPLSEESRGLGDWGKKLNSSSEHGYGRPGQRRVVSYRTSIALPAHCIPSEKPRLENLRWAKVCRSILIGPSPARQARIAPRSEISGGPRARPPSGGPSRPSERVRSDGFCRPESDRVRPLVGGHYKRDSCPSPTACRGAIGGQVCSKQPP
jgi:hypothetical protein